MDEGQDVQERPLTAILVETLDGELGKFNLVEIAELGNTDNVTVTQLTETTLFILYGPEVSYNRVKLLLSDAASYLIKADVNIEKQLLSKFSKRYMFGPRP